MEQKQVKRGLPVKWQRKNGYAATGKVLVASVASTSGLWVKVKEDGTSLEHKVRASQLTPA